MPLNYKTWNAAERQYQKQGMSPKEIKRYRKAWEKKHGKQPEPSMLGTGGLRQNLDKELDRRKVLDQIDPAYQNKGSRMSSRRSSNLEKLASKLKGKKF